MQIICCCCGVPLVLPLWLLSCLSCIQYGKWTFSVTIIVCPAKRTIRKAFCRANQVLTYPCFRHRIKLCRHFSQTVKHRRYRTECHIIMVYMRRNVAAVCGNTALMSLQFSDYETRPMAHQQNDFSRFPQQDSFGSFSPNIMDFNGALKIV